MDRQQRERRQISRRTREPADAHFRKLQGTSSAPCAELGQTPGTFEVYRADEERTSSTRFIGGDRHWRLRDGEGLILLDTGGYASESDCLSAIAILQQHAGFARLSRQE